MVKYLKIIVGQVILASILFLIVKHGELFRNLDIKLLITTTVISVLLIILNGLSIKVIADAYCPDKKMSVLLAVQIGALSTFGNSLGGLPIGTSLKFAILNRKMGIKLANITAGLMLFALCISTFLAIFALLVIPYIELAIFIKVLTAAIVLFVALLAWLVVIGLAKRNILANYIAPFVTSYKWYLIILSALLSLGLILNYVVAGYFLAPQISNQKIVFIASLGSLMSVLTFSQTVGGVQELSIGLASFLTELNFIKGIEFAFALRIAALISSSVLLLFLIPYFATLKRVASTEN